MVQFCDSVLPESIDDLNKHLMIGDPRYFYWKDETPLDWFIRAAMEVYIIPSVLITPDKAAKCTVSKAEWEAMLKVICASENPELKYMMVNIPKDVQWPVCIGQGHANSPRRLFTRNGLLQIFPKIFMRNPTRGRIQRATTMKHIKAQRKAKREQVTREFLSHASVNELFNLCKKSRSRWAEPFGEI